MRQLMHLLGKGRYLLLIVASLTLLAGCSQEASQQTLVRQAMAIESGDECHLCGMTIQRFPGPKGELYEKNAAEIRKFCSTRDLFAYLLQPENRHLAQEVYVHDMTVTPWQRPDDETFIDARSAWYVAGSSQQGAMGPTLASFAQQAHAHAFAQEFGGQVLRFDEITLELLNPSPTDMGGHQPHAPAGHGHVMDEHGMEEHKEDHKMESHDMQAMPGMNGQG